MADVQAENGYTRIANELFEAILRARVPGRHKDVLFAVVRFTYGYNRPYGAVPSRLIAAALELDVRTVRRILRDLIAWRMLDRDKKRDRRSQVLRVHKDFDDWRPGRSRDAARRNPTEEDLGQIPLWGGSPLLHWICSGGDRPSSGGATAPLLRGGTAPLLKTKDNLKTTDRVGYRRSETIAPLLLNDPGRLTRGPSIEEPGPRGSP